MPKLARSAALLSAALSLAVPAAAAAESITVDPALGGSSCSGTKCPTIQTGIDRAAAGDTVNVLKGTYAESPTVDKAITISGVGAGDVKVTGSGTGDVLTLEAAGISMSGMTIEVPADAGSAIVAPAADTTLSNFVAQRANPSSVNAPVVAIGGAADITGGFVVQGAGSGTAGIASTGTGGLTLTDSLVVSSTGPGLTLTEGAANRIVRSTLASTATGGDALRFAAASSAADKKLVMDSSFLIGGAGAAAIAVLTSGGTAGDVVVNGRHISAVGGKGAVLDASGAAGTVLGGGPAGNITATFSSSIVHAASTTKEFVPTVPLLQEANAVSLTFASSDAPPATGDGTIDMGGASNTEDAKLFAPNSLRLRVDAPVIDKGAAPAADESDTDVEGDPRVAGAASDIGADEYVNKPPVAKFGIANPKAAIGEDVGFISGSTDPEQDAGGGIAEYRWDFGDGTREVTNVLGVVHKYAKVGTYQVTLQVVDRQGAVSAVSAPQAVTIVEPGVGPTLAIAVPGQGQKIKLRRSGGRRPLPLTILGSWVDPQGIKSIEVSLRLVKKDKVRKKRRRARRSQATTCRYYSGRRFSRKPCTEPIWLPAAVKATGFALQTRKGRKLPRGRYEVRVRGTDAQGNASAAPSKAGNTLVAFRIR